MLEHVCKRTMRQRAGWGHRGMKHSRAGGGGGAFPRKKNQPTVFGAKPKVSLWRESATEQPCIPPQGYLELLDSSDSSDSSDSIAMSRSRSRGNVMYSPMSGAKALKSPSVFGDDTSHIATRLSESCYVSDDEGARSNSRTGDMSPVRRTPTRSLSFSVGVTPGKQGNPNRSVNSLLSPDAASGVSKAILVMRAEPGVRCGMHARRA